VLTVLEIYLRLLFVLTGRGNSALLSFSSLLFSFFSFFSAELAESFFHSFCQPIKNVNVSKTLVSPPDGCLSDGKILPWPGPIVIESIRVLIGVQPSSKKLKKKKVVVWIWICVCSDPTTELKSRTSKKLIAYQVLLQCQRHEFISRSLSFLWDTAMRSVRW
jgi:hypothetical protein